MIPHPQHMTQGVDGQIGWVSTDHGGNSFDDAADLSPPLATDTKISHDVRELIATAAECLGNFRRVVNLPPESLEDDTRLLTSIVTNGGLGVADMVEEKAAIADRGHEIVMTQEALQFYVRAQRLLLYAKMLFLGTTDSQRILKDIEIFGEEFALIAREVIEMHGMGEVLVHVRTGVDVILGLH